MALNELKDYMLQTLPPTDSRLRPAVRILEEGNIGKFLLYLLPDADLSAVVD